MIGCISVVCNEEERLPQMITNIRPWVDQVVIVVQESQDRTLTIAQRLADVVIEQSCIGYCEPHREIASQACREPWQLLLDADETITKQFAKQMRPLLMAGPMGYYLHRKTTLDGKFWCDEWHYRFFDKRAVKFLDQIHTQPQERFPGLASSINDYVAIEHHKTSHEQSLDDTRTDNLKGTIW